VFQLQEVNDYLGYVMTQHTDHCEIKSWSLKVLYPSRENFVTEM
jgi:hypothetical protein